MVGGIQGTRRAGRSRGLTPGAGDDHLVPDDGSGYETRAVDRLTIFSDAVVAIAITLLAIDLPVPEGDTVSEFWSSVRHNDGHYAAFLISFVVIAAAWSNHHDLFRYARRIDSRLRTFNTGWLLMIVLIPFATRLLTASGQPTLDAHALRFGFYALLQVLASASVARDAAAHVSHRQAAWRPAAGRQPALTWAVLWRDARLRAVDPGLLRHDLRRGCCGSSSRCWWPGCAGFSAGPRAPGRPPVRIRHMADVSSAPAPPTMGDRGGEHRARRRIEKDVMCA